MSETITYETNEQGEQIKVTKLETGHVIRELVSAPQDPPRQTVFSKLEFRARLSDNEQIILDNFSVQEFAAQCAQILDLSVMERAEVRTAIATYNEAGCVDITDPRTVRMIGMLGAYGLLDHANRAAEILT